MDRGATLAFIDEAEAEVNRPCFLYVARFETGVIRLTDAAVNVAWSGSTYVASQAISFSGLTEDRRVVVNTVNVSVSGVDQALVAIALADGYMDRDLEIYRAFLDANLEVIADPLLIFSGRMSGMQIATDPDAGTCGVTISAGSHLADFERRAGRHANNADQQVFFPDDLGLEYAGTLPDRVFWGQTDPNQPRFTPLPGFNPTAFIDIG